MAHRTRFIGVLFSLALLCAPVSAYTATPDETVPESGPKERPLVLLPLYASLTTLQVLDLHSTLHARINGAQELNPLVGRSKVSLWAMKTAAAGVMVYLVERTWKKNPAAAVALAVGMNSAYLMIVARNYRVASRAALRR